MFSVYKKLFSYIPDRKGLAYLAIFFSALSAMLMAGALYYLYEFLRGLLLSGNTASAAAYALVIVSMMLAGSLLYMTSGVLAHMVAFRLETNLRKRGIDGLMASNFAFFGTSSSGKIRKIIDDNAAETHTIVAHLIPDNVGVVVTPLMIVGLAFVIQPLMGFLLLLLIAIGAWQVKGMVGKPELMSLYAATLENLNSATVEYVRGMQVIKIFKTSVASFKALSQAIQAYSETALQYSFTCRRAYVSFQVLFASYILLLISAFAFLLPEREQLHLLPQFLYLFSVIGLLFTCFMRVMYLGMYQYKAVEVIDKIEQLYQQMTENKVYQGSEEELIDGSLAFQEVSFGYEEDQLILDRLSFRLEANKVYALVGASGSGKSTIAKLMAGFYKAGSGQILLGQKPIESYSQEAAMRQIAFVFQQSKLFKLSIYDNVRLGRPEASREEVMRALDLACCQDILDKFPDREETQIGAEGVHLSGGEMQRLAIARAILKDARLLILDEASASTDVNNEYQIQQAFARLMENKTVIIIAHRLSSIRGVDEILVIDQGRIVERGRDQDLSEKSGLYRRLKELYASADEWRVS
ncbi:ABC transporter ATP-binding protein [Streptococcus panodentis]|uniref:ABC transporter ATP-binding protein n=1 Tax=Streptococcus panodentis TaxID=1581472 RepID=A0ABS5AUR8_9STRE|nr:ABC transporter ATP-binding protein [Streptococcus panodentis]MBP2620021.1 ABC transporter ATP-binding protein [Streptococcus panodentis]